MRVSLKAINSELERLGARAVLARGDGYFYFLGGEATDWLDRTVRVPTLSSLALDQWAEEFLKLREKNRQLMKSVQPAKSNAKRTQPKGASERASTSVQGSFVFGKGHLLPLARALDQNALLRVAQ